MNQQTDNSSMPDKQAYVGKQFDLLGDADPIEVLSRTAGELKRIVGENERSTLCRRPFEGKWTPTEIIGHLTDSEWIFGFRIHHILCEDEPTLVPLDQDQWVTALRHNERDPADLTDMFAALRLVNIDRWRRTSADQLARKGIHGERGGESLGFMLKLQAGHDLSHLDQLSRYLGAIGQDVG